MFQTGDLVKLDPDARINKFGGIIPDIFRNKELVVHESRHGYVHFNIDGIPKGGWDEARFMLVEPEPAPAPLPPVSFVFIEEGDDWIKVGTGDYASLEDAHKRCLELRKLYKTEKIFSYVRVE